MEEKPKEKSPEPPAPERRRGKNDIKSNSLVKFEAHKLVQFSRLQYNTDLNLPPSNWLSDRFGLKHFSHPQPSTTGFTSFRMANTFLDTIGDVDVISDAENIKRILKLPYNPKSTISMVVHRIGSTLLIDSFDIHKYLLRQSSHDWSWLKAFVYNSMSEQDRAILLRTRGTPREILQKHNLQSKFLYYSAMGEEEGEKGEIGQNQEKPIVGPLLPDPNYGSAAGGGGCYQHNRNVIWTFEDIKMLIGTDVPIFGNEDRPVLTLRLREQTKPINVLTGIDYWLDNLMCNVPEVLMCYHTEGIVQNYEIIKTEDLPDYGNSKFHPDLIKNVAQNILAFLKMKATKPGHTYWLYKGKNDEYVKLYDLSTLCMDPMSENPLTKPVAMLLYTLARNIQHSNLKTKKSLKPKVAGAVKSLLENCIKLLPKEQHAEIVTSSYYLLSDLFVPSFTDPQKPDFSNSTEEDSEFDEEEYDDGNDSESDFASKSIKEALEKSDSKFINPSPPPLDVVDVVERCSIALNHVISGLSNIQFIGSSEDEKQKEEAKAQRIYEEQNPIMANPSQSIPLPFETLKNSTKNQGNQDDDGATNETSLLPLASAGVIKSWSTHLKLLLFEKACLIYWTKAQDAYSHECYGISLKYFYIALRCHQFILHHCPDLEVARKIQLLGSIGNCFFQFAKNYANFEKYLNGFSLESDVDQKILEEIYKEIPNGIQQIDFPKPMEAIEELLETSIYFHSLALEMKPIKNDVENELKRRLGSLKNEIASYYLKKVATKVELGENVDKVELEKIKTIILEALEIFKNVKDIINSAILYNTLARYYRFLSHFYMQNPSVETKDLNAFKKLVNEAIKSYDLALASLETKETNPILYENIKWDISTTYFNAAKIIEEKILQLQHLNILDVQKFIIDLLQNSLRKCDADVPGPRQDVYKYRAAIIHCQLGSIYHLQHMSKPENLDKNSRFSKYSSSLCRTHYDKAASYFISLEETRDLLEVQLKRIAIQVASEESNSNLSSKQKILLTELALFFEIKPFLKHSQNEGIQDIPKLLNYLMTELQSCLKKLVSVSIKLKQKETKIQMYKEMYVNSLKWKPEKVDKEADGEEEIEKKNEEKLEEEQKSLKEKMDTARNIIEIIQKLNN